MPYAVGLDTVGTDNPIIIDGVPVEGDYVEITFDQYREAINHLVNGEHICVVDGELVMPYTPPEEP